MSAQFELITLKNGHRAVRHLGHGEVMHPAVGPWAEANALYVEQAGLARRLLQQGPALKLWDVGLGAATNAVAALGCLRGLGTQAKRTLEVDSFEVSLEPLQLALADPEGFPFLVPFEDAAKALIATGHWESEGIVWRLHLGDVRETMAKAAPCPELVYWDPFSPEANPTLWTKEAFQGLHSFCAPPDSGAPTELFTYSSATPTRVSLLLGGFFVGAGDPIGYKKETTVAATAKGVLARPLEERWRQRWRRSSARSPHGEVLTPELESEVEAHPQFR